MHFNLAQHKKNKAQITKQFKKSGKTNPIQPCIFWQDGEKHEHVKLLHPFLVNKLASVNQKNHGKKMKLQKIKLLRKKNIVPSQKDLHLHHVRNERDPHLHHVRNGRRLSPCGVAHSLGRQEKVLSFCTDHFFWFKQAMFLRIKAIYSLRILLIVNKSWNQQTVKADQ